MLQNLHDSSRYLHDLVAWPVLPHNSIFHCFVSSYFSFSGKAFYL